MKKYEFICEVFMQKEFYNFIINLFIIFRKIRGLRTFLFEHNLVNISYKYNINYHDLQMSNSKGTCLLNNIQ